MRNAHCEHLSSEMTPKAGVAADMPTGPTFPCCVASANPISPRHTQCNGSASSPWSPQFGKRGLGCAALEQHEADEATWALATPASADACQLCPWRGSAKLRTKKAAWSIASFNRRGFDLSWPPLRVHAPAKSNRGALCRRSRLGYSLAQKSGATFNPREKCRCR
jgi:hypothetical protein